MANNRIQFETQTDRGTVLGTELNALSNGSRTNAGTEFDNATAKDTRGFFRLSVDFVSAPSAGGYVAVYAVHCKPGGSTYADGSSSVDPGPGAFVCAIPLRADTAAQVIDSQTFPLRGVKTKYILYNGSGQAFPASGSTLELITGCQEVE